jgi:glycosyltransferase involved in cell wall biosynthesis
MASGIPVISTTSGGSRALISDRITGLLVEEQSPLAITAAIEMMLADEGLRTRISQAALIAVAHHTWAHVGRDILTKYQALSGASI